MKRIIFGLVLFASLGLAQGARILIVTDLEGVGGVNDPDEQLLPGQRRYLESRKILTGEVNAAVDGAVAAGASEIVVWDGHDGSRTLSIDEIHSPARLLQGRPTPANYYLSDRLYDGVIFIGQHAKAGAKDAVLAHTQSFAVRRLTINGKEVGELGQVAAIAGQFGIPVIMLSGDRAACAEMLELQPRAVTVEVKRLAGRGSTVSLSHEQATRLILDGAIKAVRSAGTYSPWKIQGPVEMTIEYFPQPPQQPTARIVSYKGATVLEAYEAWLGKL
ncbi:MAG: M55 family metallopeptidase [Acidobacteria bacterium]|nr:M55 family metallopeptidase [Acidobacteriota bacterium]